jgi:predicted component of type VI protein secretion system
MLPLVIQIERLKERVAETCAFAQSPVRIGRNPLNDVELDDGYVSQWHGVIRFADGQTTYLDLGSTNPTLIDGKPVDRNMEVPITETTDLRIGSFRLHVIRADAPPELFGARRKTAFARTGVGDASSVAATMFFGGEPTKLRSKSAMYELAASAHAEGALSGPPPVQPRSPLSEPPVRMPGPNGPPAVSLPSVIVSQQLIRSQPPVAISQPPVQAQQPAVLSQPPPFTAGSSSPSNAPGSSRPPVRPSGGPPPLPSNKPMSSLSSGSLRAASIAPTVAVARSESSPAPVPSSTPSAYGSHSASGSYASPSAVQNRSPVSDSMPVPTGTNDGLREAYENYRNSWRALLAELRYRLERAASGRRSEMLDNLVQQYPDIGREAEFRVLISELGISPLRTGVPEMEDWLRRLTDNMFPPPNAAINLALAMERIGEVLEVFSTAFVEMRDAHGRFCDEMSLERPTADSILQTTKNPRLALAYLLNPSSEGASKVEELARSMADFALHQVALVSAVVEGARGMLQELSPDAVVDPKAKKQQKSGGLFGGLFSNEAQVRWNRFRSLFGEMVDEDRFTRRLFGRQFARKYYAIMGGRRSITPSNT